MNLSNIFEYMDPELFRQTAKQLIDSLEKGGRLAYWNLLVPRHIASEFPSEIKGLTELSAELSASDNGFFYNQFLVDERL